MTKTIVTNMSNNETSYINNLPNGNKILTSTIRFNELVDYGDQCH